MARSGDQKRNAHGADPGTEGLPGSEDQFARGAGAPAGEDPVEDMTGAAEDAERSTSEPDEAREDRSSGDTATGDRAYEEQRDKYLRLAAEYDNYRKRVTRERQETGTRAQADVIRLFMDALDDLSRFAHVDAETVDSGTVVRGVEMVESKMLKALGALGLEIVEPLDEAFDPALHEAVATEPALSREDDHMIARVYQRGYVFNGQLLRPARVVVKQWNG